MFVQLEGGETFEITGSSKKLGLFVHFLNWFYILGSETLPNMLLPFSLLVVSSLCQARQPWRLRSRCSKSMSCDGSGLPGSQNNFGLHAPPWIQCFFPALPTGPFSAAALPMAFPALWRKACKRVSLSWQSNLTLEIKATHCWLLGQGDISQPQKSPDAYLGWDYITIVQRSRRGTIFHECCHDHLG